MVKYIFGRIKGGLLPTFIGVLIIIAFNFIVSLPARLEWVKNLGRHVKNVPLGETIFNLIIITAVIFLVGVLKHHGVLSALAARLRPQGIIARIIRSIFGSKKEESFMFIVRGPTAFGPAMGVVTTEFFDLVDGRQKYRVYYPSPPNILTGPPIVDWDVDRFITKDDLVRLGFKSVDDAVKNGYLVIYSDLRSSLPEYGFEQLIIATTSFGKLSPPATN